MSKPKIKVMEITSCSKCPQLHYNSDMLWWNCALTLDRIKAKDVVYIDGTFPDSCPLSDKVEDLNKEQPLQGVTCSLCGSPLVFRLNKEPDGWSYPEAHCTGDMCGVGISMGAFGSGLTEYEIIKSCVGMLNSRPQGG